MSDDKLLRDIKQHITDLDAEVEKVLAADLEECKRQPGRQPMSKQNAWSIAAVRLCTEK